jgi:Rrf2 family transcriptional regulator, cysteine metabolism repressor
MRLSHSVAYAVHAALQLAGSDRHTPISCGKLAEIGHMPERFLLQVLRSLSKQGILQSVRGGTGGFCLSRPAENISLLDLIEAVDGPLCAGLPTNSNLPEESSLLLRDTLDRVVEATREQLGSLKLSLLAAQISSANGNGRVNGSRNANGNGTRDAMPLAVASSLTWGI